MYRRSRAGLIVSCSFVLAMVCTSAPAFGQIDLTGVWNPRLQEDFPERIPGPELVDYLGLPINDYARKWGLSWSPGRLSLPEHQCQVHVAPYIHRGPLTLRFWEDRDPVTQQPIAIREYISTYEQNRTIWLDGRPHPPESAAHTWMGFSTGVWEGNMLTVTTTHIKQGWVRRNGLPESDLATLTEHFIRHGNQLTHISVVQDPVYLAEPLIKSENFDYVPGPGGGWLWPCEYIEETERPRGTVPSFMPGENPWLAEFAVKNGLPQEATLGGPETMYPEYRIRMKQLPKAVNPAPPAK